MTLAALGTLNIGGSAPYHFKHNKIYPYMTINKIHNTLRIE